MDDFNQAIRIKHDYAEVYYNRGIVYTNIGEYIDAIEDMKRAIKWKDSFENSKLGIQIVRNLMDIQNLVKVSDFESAHKLAIEAMEIAKKTNDKDWVKIMNLKIKEIEDLQK